MLEVSLTHSLTILLDQMAYFCFNADEAENSDPRRSGRLEIEEWVTQYPDTNVAVIISAHASDNGLLAHAYASDTLKNTRSTRTAWDLTPCKVSSIKTS